MTRQERLLESFQSQWEYMKEFTEEFIETTSPEYGKLSEAEINRIGIYALLKKMDQVVATNHTHTMLILDALSQKK